MTTRILRIIALVPVYALVFFLAGSVPSAAIYLEPWADAYEAVALTSYFLLLVTYVVPDPRKRDGFFDQLQQPNSNEGSLTWYRVSLCRNCRKWYGEVADMKRTADLDLRIPIHTRLIHRRRRNRHYASYRLVLHQWTWRAFRSRLGTFSTTSSTHVPFPDSHLL